MCRGRERERERERKEIEMNFLVITITVALVGCSVAETCYAFVAHITACINCKDAR